MKRNITKLLFVLSIFFSVSIHAQNIRVANSYNQNTGLINFALFIIDENGKVIAKTDAVFSSAKVIDTSTGQNVIAAIPVGRYLSNDEYRFSEIWLCLDNDLEIKFYYPVGTTYVRTWKDDITLFFTSSIDGHTGAINSNGDVILNPKYTYLTLSGIYINGITELKETYQSIIFHCDVYNKIHITQHYTFNVVFDLNVPIYIKPIAHKTYSPLINTVEFSEMMKEYDSYYDNDAKLYLWGVHMMLNMNYKEALSFFAKIENKSFFHGIEDNIHQCKEILDEKSTLCSLCVNLP